MLSSQSFDEKKNTLFIILIIFLLNFSLKLINITYDPIWYDECFSVYYGQGSVSEILGVSKWDINPPFFFILLSFWMKIFGTSELAVRMFPVIISSAAGVMLYLFIKKYFDSRTAITASVLYLTSHISFYYSHEVRAYCFILLISIVSLWLFIRLFEKPSIIVSVGLAATYYMLIMSHYLTFFIPLSHGILLILFLNRQLLKYYIITCLFFCLFMAHWASRIFELATEKNKHWLQSPTIDDLTQFIFSVFNGKWFFLLFVVISLVGVITIFVKKEPVIKNNSVKIILLYALFSSALTILLNYLISYKIPIFLDRYLLFTLIGFIILVSFFISRIRIPAFIYYSLISLIGVYLLWTIPINGPVKKMDYRNAVHYVKIEQDSNTLVFVQTIDVASLFAYYYDKDIFKKYHELESSLMEKMVYTGNDSTMIRPFDESQYTKIILVQTYAEYADPNKTVIDFFKKRNYTLIKETNEYTGVSISIYQNNTNVVKDPSSRIQKRLQFQESLIQDKINYIKTDAVWMNDIRRKALENNIPLDTALRRDAMYVLNIKN